MDEKYLMPTQGSRSKICFEAIQGSVVMFNLLRFRDIADYSESPELMPVEPIRGKMPINCILNIPCHFDEVGWRNIIYGGKVVIF